MSCRLGRGWCEYQRDAKRWKAVAVYALAMAVINFAFAWAVAFCKVAGVME